MAESDVLKGELSSGFETGEESTNEESTNDEFEHPIMLYSGPRNRNDTKLDGVFGRNRAPYEVEFLFDRGQEFSSLRVQGRIKFYVTSRDSLHEDVLRQYYQMIGQVDLTSRGGKVVENVLWGSAKAIYR